jgi:caa(3)-type oxidase subunit IV
MSEHHHTNYKKIYIWLVILFLVSVAGPEIFEGNKPLVLIFAFGIAVVKAIIVAGWFMHLKDEKRYIWYAFITSLSLLFIFIIAVAPDIMNESGKNWVSNIKVVAEKDDRHGHGAEHATDESHTTENSTIQGDHGHAH